MSGAGRTLRVGSVNIGGVNNSPLEFMLSRLEALSASVLDFVNRKHSADVLKSQYYDVPGEQFYNFLCLTKSRPDKLYRDREEYKQVWDEYFARYPGNAEPMEAEIKKNDKLTTDSIKLHLFNYSWLLMEAVTDFCDKQGWDNLPAEFYDADYLTTGRKAKSLSQFIQGQKIDVMCIQEVSPEMYDLLREDLSSAGYKFSANVSSSVLIYNASSFTGDLQDAKEFDNVNGQTVYVSNGNLCIAGTHLTSKGKKKSPKKNYEDQAEQLKLALSGIRNCGIHVICAGDFNHAIDKAGIPDGFKFVTDPKGTDNKKRTSLQAQYDKIHVESSAVKDGHLYDDGVQLLEFFTMTLDGGKVSADKRVYIPNPEHPTDHFATVAVYQF